MTTALLRTAVSLLRVQSVGGGAFSVVRPSDSETIHNAQTRHAATHALPCGRCDATIAGSRIGQVLAGEAVKR